MTRVGVYGQPNGHHYCGKGQHNSRERPNDTAVGSLTDEPVSTVGLRVKEGLRLWFSIMALTQTHRILATVLLVGVY